LEYRVITSTFIPRREQTALVADLRQEVIDAFEKQDIDGSVGEQILQRKFIWRKHSWRNPPPLVVADGFELSAVRCVVNDEETFQLDFSTMRDQGQLNQTPEE
jgi:hypothetical protein